MMDVESCHDNVTFLILERCLLATSLSEYFELIFANLVKREILFDRDYGSGLRVIEGHILLVELFIFDASYRFFQVFGRSADRWCDIRESKVVGHILVKVDVNVHSNFRIFLVLRKSILNPCLIFYGLFTRVRDELDRPVQCFFIPRFDGLCSVGRLDLKCELICFRIFDRLHLQIVLVRVKCKHIFV